MLTCIDSAERKIKQIKRFSNSHDLWRCLPSFSPNAVGSRQIRVQMKNITTIYSMFVAMIVKYQSRIYHSFDKYPMPHDDKSRTLQHLITSRSVMFATADLLNGDVVPLALGPNISFSSQDFLIVESLHRCLKTKRSVHFPPCGFMFTFHMSQPTG